MELRKPAPDPPRPRILPGAGSRQPGPRRPGAGGVLRTVGSSSSSSPGPCESSSRCRYSRSRRSCMRGPGAPPARGRRTVTCPCGTSPGGCTPGPRAPAGESPGQIPAGVRTPPRPSSAPPHRSCRGSGPAGADGGATWTRDDPRGVRTWSVRVGPGAAVAGADRAQGECGPGKVVQRAHGGALLFGPLAFRWITAVRLPFSSAKCTSRCPGRGGVGRRGPRDRRVTREIVG